MRHRYLTFVLVCILAVGTLCCAGAQSSNPPSGSVWAWGANNIGELGNGTFTSPPPYGINHPVQTLDPDGTSYLAGVTAIAAGDYYSLALKSDGTVWGWGSGGYGQLGNNSNNNSRLPIQVEDPSNPSQPLTNVTAIAAGDGFSLAIVSSPNRFDLNADGYPDLLWENQTTGEIYYWLMNEATKIGGAAISGNADPNWQIVAVADINGDGHPDLIWENQTTGEVYYWLMNGTTRIGNGAIPGNTDPNGKIVAVADLNGDGHADLIWENQTTGAVSYWLMNGTTRISGGAISGNTNPDWKIVGVTDLNSDGSPDLIWENQQTGEVYYWLMNGTARIGEGAIPGNADPNWKIVAR